LINIEDNNGLRYFLLPLLEWLALPGNSGPAPNGGVINIGGYDIDGIIEAPAADATSVTVKLYEIRISDRKIVYLSCIGLSYYAKIHQLPCP
jgi:hypothetical protein